MEKYSVKKDIPLCCIEASSFPDGVLAAHQQLHSYFTDKAGRRFFGISRPQGERGIIYKAAVELQVEEKAEDFGGHTGMIKKGEYTSIVIKDFRKDISAIGQSFETLLEDPDIDPNGYCIEMYMGMDGVRCMIRLNDN